LQYTSNYQNTTDVHELILTQKQHASQLNMAALINEQAKEILCLLYIIENALLILWRHLDYFLARSSTLQHTQTASKSSYLNLSPASQPTAYSLNQPQNQLALYQDPNIMTDTNTSMSFAPLITISSREYETLKNESNGILNPILTTLEQLDNENNNMAFIRALVDKIQRLIAVK